MRVTGTVMATPTEHALRANRDHPRPRNPLGMRRVFAGGGDATPFTPHQDD